MLYFVGAGDRIKIGISRDPDVRRATLQTGNSSQCRVLLALDITNEVEIERLLHSTIPS